MKIVNKSRKVIGINGEPLLPGYTMDLPECYEKHPAVLDYMKKGILVNANKDVSEEGSGGISDSERAMIAEEAVNKYKQEQDALKAAQAKKQAEIDAVKDMKKSELLLKAAGMGLEVKDNDTVDVLRGKILAKLDK